MTNFRDLRKQDLRNDNLVEFWERSSDVAGFTGVTVYVLLAGKVDSHNSKTCTEYIRLLGTVKMRIVECRLKSVFWDDSLVASECITVSGSLRSHQTT